MDFKFPNVGKSLFSRGLKSVWGAAGDLVAKFNDDDAAGSLAGVGIIEDLCGLRVEGCADVGLIGVRRRPLRPATVLDRGNGREFAGLAVSTLWVEASRVWTCLTRFVLLCSVLADERGV